MITDTGRMPLMSKIKISGCFPLMSTINKTETQKGWKSHANCIR